jgi:hypothetical protein
MSYHDSRALHKKRNLIDVKACYRKFRIWVNKRFGTVICTPSSYASSHISCVWKDSWLSRMWGPVARSEKAGPQCFCLYEYEYVHEPGKEGTAYVCMHTSETETMHFARKLFACDDSLQMLLRVPHQENTGTKCSCSVQFSFFLRRTADHRDLGRNKPGCAADATKQLSCLQSRVDACLFNE